MEPHITQFWLHLKESFPEELVILIFTQYKEVIGIPTFSYDIYDRQVWWTGKYTTGSVHSQISRIWLYRPYSETEVTEEHLSRYATRDEFQKSLEYGGDPCDCGNFRDDLDELVALFQSRKHEDYWSMNTLEWEQDGIALVAEPWWSDSFVAQIEKWKLKGNDWVFVPRGGDVVWLLHDIDAVIAELLIVKKYCKAECEKWFISYSSQLSLLI